MCQREQSLSKKRGVLSGEERIACLNRMTAFYTVTDAAAEGRLRNVFARVSP